jgi:hypothetical protein
VNAPNLSPCLRQTEKWQHIPVTGPSSARGSLAEMKRVSGSWRRVASLSLIIPRFALKAIRKFPHTNKRRSVILLLKIRQSKTPDYGASVGSHYLHKNKRNYALLLAAARPETIYDVLRCWDDVGTIKNPKTQ